MRRIISLVFVFVLMFVFAGCNNTPEKKEEKNNAEIVQTAEDASLSALKEKIRSDGKLMGVAYLGWLEGDLETAKNDLGYLEYTKDIPFVKDISKYTETEGYRMYLIVPADDDVSVSVHRCEFNDEYVAYAGEELITSNQPILVRGNISDTIPNIYVIAKTDSEIVEYTPAQSGMDGKLENSGNRVYDFTPYEMLPEFSAFDKAPDSVFCGNWSAVVNDGNGDERVLNLAILSDGSAEYSYGIGNSEILEQFDGTWAEIDGVISFYLTGGVPESVENPSVNSPYDCISSFEWDMNEKGLILKHVDGDEILYGTKGMIFEFSSADE